MVLHHLERLASALTLNPAMRELRREVLAALEDGVLTAAEVSALEAKCTALGLPREALGRLRATAYAAALRATTKDRRLTESESLELARVAETFGVTQAQQQSSVADLAHFRLLAELEAGCLPELPTTTLALGPSETAHGEEAAEAYEFQTKSVRVTSGSGSSTRIFKGFSVRSMRSVSHTVSTEELKPVAAGKLVLTSERLVLVSPVDTVEMRLGDIISAEAWADGFSIATRKRKRPLIIKLPDPRALERTAVLLGALMGNVGGER